VLSTQKPNTVPTGVTVTDWFPHPLDPNVGTTYSGRFFTCYKARKHGGVTTDEWRELIPKNNEIYRGCPNSSRTGDVLVLPATAAEKIYGSKRPGRSGRFALECYLGRPLLSFEVARHGVNGPADHSYTNLQVGDSVNNMIDDLENGKSITSLSYLLEAVARLTRLICSYRLNSTKPTEYETTEATC
jgi:hypothetical protein